MTQWGDESALSAGLGALGVAVAALALIALGFFVWHLIGELKTGDEVEVVPRVADTWALLDVWNRRAMRCTFRAEARIIRGNNQTEEPYSVRWRESDLLTIEIDGNRGHQVLNVAEASLPRGPGSQGFRSLRYTSFHFHTARLPVGGGQVSESFQRDQETEEGFVVEVAFTTEPPLRRELRKHYRLRATEEPDTFTFDMSTPDDLVESALGEAERRTSPKIEYEEIEIE